MVKQVKSKAVADKNIIFEMRRAGAPMREIAEKEIGRASCRERV
jgi:hypothetical protein